MGNDVAAHSQPPAERRPLGRWLAARDARDAALLLLFLGTAAALAWFQATLPPGRRTVLWSGWGLALLLVFGGGVVRLFGPLPFHDLVRTARRGRFFLLRTVYAAALLLLMAAIYAWWSWKLPPGRPSGAALARFAEQFFLAFMAAQFTAALVLTPAWVASAIAAEKDLQTLDFLLATDLDKREIVLGKLAGRFISLALLFLAGLPILAFTQFFGGIDPNVVLIGAGVLGLTLLSLSAVSILHSVCARRARSAIVLTYLTITLYLGLSYLAAEYVPEAPAVAHAGVTFDWDGLTHAITVQSVIDALAAGNLLVVLRTLAAAWQQGAALTRVLPGLVRSYALFHAVTAVLCAVWAVARLRSAARHEGAAPGRVPPRRWWSWPTLDANALLWKEVAVDPGLRLSRSARLLIVALAVASFIPAAAALWNYHVDLRQGPSPGVLENLQRNLRSEVQDWVKVVGTLVGCAALLAVAVRAAGSVSGEQARRSLDNLLTTPLNRDAILGSKWQASILAVRWTWLWLGLIWAVGVGVGALSACALPLLAWAWIVYALFTANLGLWYSTVCRTPLRATACTLLSLLGAAFGHWLTLGCYLPFFLFSAGRRDDFPEWLLLFQTYGLTPPATLGALVFTMDDLRRNATMLDGRASAALARLISAVLGLIAYGVGGSMLWTLASNRFRAIGLAQPLHKGLFGGSENPFAAASTSTVDVELVPVVEKTPAGDLEL